MSVTQTESADLPVSIAEGPGEANLVSVVIPAYNRAYILPATIESVLRQTHRPIEVLVVDDGSKDDTRQVVERYGPPVKYIHQSNAGVAAARNTGLRHGRGEFLALLDSDDQFHPWKLEAQVRLLRAHPQVGMVWTDMTAIADDGALVQQRYLRTFYPTYALVDEAASFSQTGAVADFWPEAPTDLQTATFKIGEIFSPMLLGNLVHTSTVLLRRETVRRVGGFDESRPTPGEDYEFHLHTCYLGPVALLDAPSIDYRIGNPDQLTAPEKMVVFARENLVTLDIWLQRGKDRNRLTKEQLRRRLVDAHRWLGAEEMRFGSSAAARRHLLHSLKLQPAQPRAMALLLFSMMPRSFYRHVQRWRHRG